MTLKTLLIGLSLVLAVAACSSDRQGSVVSPPSPQGSNKPSPVTRASLLANEFTISCADADCSPSVGILFKKSTESSRCTTFVVGEVGERTIVATNKHCVDSISSCSQDIFVRFPEVGRFGAEAAACERVLNESSYPLRAIQDGKEIVLRNPDYAFIQLDRKLSRPALTLTQAGLGEATPVSTQYFDDGSRYRSLILKKVDCNTYDFRSTLLLNYTHAKSPVIGVFGCNVKGGNSGAPVFNAEGKVAAILQIGPTEDAEKTHREAAANVKEVDMNALEITKSGVATNLACIDFAPLGLTSARGGGACELNPKTDSSPVNERKIMLDVLRESLKEAFRFTRADDSKLFSWGLQKVEDFGAFTGLRTQPVMGFEIFPSCVYHPDERQAGINKYRQKTFGIFDSWVRSAMVQYTTRAWFSVLVLNHRGVMSGALRSSPANLVISIRPGEIAGLGEHDKATLRVNKNGLNSTFEIGLCKRGEIASDLEDLEKVAKIAETGTDEEFYQYLEKESKED